MIWQLIETALKNEDEPILVFNNNDGFCRTRVAWWDGVGWCYYAKFAGPSVRLLHVTHWMPLPDPPVAAIRQED